MIEIITKTPFYVWPLLGYLIFIGIKASKTNIIPIKILFIMPIIFTAWSSIVLSTRYGFNPLIFFFWGISMLAGIGIGMAIIRRFSLRFDKEKKLIQISGSWSTLILSLAIFSVRYFLGAMYAMHPELIQSGKLVFLECAAALLAGCFTGRLIGCLRKYKTATHETLI